MKSKSTILAVNSDIPKFYRIIFEREPDPEGLDYFQKLVASGISRFEIYLNFKSSEEWEALPSERKLQIQDYYARDFSLPPILTKGISWFHSVELPDGNFTQGHKSHETLQAEASKVFKFDITDKSVLDIGAWDGFFSFEAEKRGAEKVLSTDHFSWSGPGWGTKDGYNALHRTFNSNADSLDVDVFELDPSKHGTFDVVLFLGVLYHLKDPYAGLQKAADMTDELLIVETETVFNYMKEPVMRYFVGSEMSNDDTNFWAPNLECLRCMLLDLGFRRCEFTQNGIHPIPIHTWRDKNKLCRYIVHAWR